MTHELYLTFFNKGENSKNQMTKSANDMKEQFI